QQAFQFTLMHWDKDGRVVDFKLAQDKTLVDSDGKIGRITSGQVPNGQIALTVDTGNRVDGDTSGLTVLKGGRPNDVLPAGTLPEQTKQHTEETAKSEAAAKTAGKLTYDSLRFENDGGRLANNGVAKFNYLFDNNATGTVTESYASGEYTYGKGVSNVQLSNVTDKDGSALATTTWGRGSHFFTNAGGALVRPEGYMKEDLGAARTTALEGKSFTSIGWIQVMDQKTGKAIGWTKQALEFTDLEVDSDRKIVGGFNGNGGGAPGIAFLKEADGKAYVRDALGGKAPIDFTRTKVENGDLRLVADSKLQANPLTAGVGTVVLGGMYMLGDQPARVIRNSKGEVILAPSESIGWEHIYSLGRDIFKRMSEDGPKPVAGNVAGGLVSPAVPESYNLKLVGGANGLLALDGKAQLNYSFDSNASAEITPYYGLTHLTFGKGVQNVELFNVKDSSNNLVATLRVGDTLEQEKNNEGKQPGQQTHANDFYFTAAQTLDKGPAGATNGISGQTLMKAINPAAGFSSVSWGKLVKDGEAGDSNQYAQAELKLSELRSSPEGIVGAKLAGDRTLRDSIGGKMLINEKDGLKVEGGALKISGYSDNKEGMGLAAFEGILPKAVFGMHPDAAQPGNWILDRGFDKDNTQGKSVSTDVAKTLLKKLAVPDRSVGNPEDRWTGNELAFTDTEKVGQPVVINNGQVQLSFNLDSSAGGTFSQFYGNTHLINATKFASLEAFELRDGKNSLATGLLEGKEFYFNEGQAFTLPKKDKDGIPVDENQLGKIFVKAIDVAKPIPLVQTIQEGSKKYGDVPQYTQITEQALSYRMDHQGRFSQDGTVLVGSGIQELFGAKANYQEGQGYFVDKNGTLRLNVKSEGNSALPAFRDTLFDEGFPVEKVEGKPGMYKLKQDWNGLVKDAEVSGDDLMARLAPAGGTAPKSDDIKHRLTIQDQAGRMVSIGDVQLVINSDSTGNGTATADYSSTAIVNKTDSDHLVLFNVLSTDGTKTLLAETALKNREGTGEDGKTFYLDANKRLVPVGTMDVKKLGTMETEAVAGQTFAKVQTVELARDDKQNAPKKYGQIMEHATLWEVDALGNLVSQPMLDVSQGVQDIFGGLATFRKRTNDNGYSFENGRLMLDLVSVKGPTAFSALKSDLADKDLVATVEYKVVKDGVQGWKAGKMLSAAQVKEYSLAPETVEAVYTLKQAVDGTPALAKVDQKFMDDHFGKTGEGSGNSFDHTLHLQKQGSRIVNDGQFQLMVSGSGATQYYGNTHVINDTGSPEIFLFNVKDAEQKTIAEGSLMNNPENKGGVLANQFYLTKDQALTTPQGSIDGAKLGWMALYADKGKTFSMVQSGTTASAVPPTGAQGVEIASHFSQTKEQATRLVVDSLGLIKKEGTVIDKTQGVTYLSGRVLPISGFDVKDGKLLIEGTTAKGQGVDLLLGQTVDNSLIGKTLDKEVRLSNNRVIPAGTEVTKELLHEILSAQSSGDSALPAPVNKLAVYASGDRLLGEGKVQLAMSSDSTGGGVVHQSFANTSLAVDPGLVK
ncbi:MAG: hypothetical protein HQL18_05395, partial [Candidatus Omnitrophica bacterium]|nr:hypothetical protein [Candidatus Omnitrophota bacterium]